MDASTATFTTDSAFEVLAHRDRRVILSQLVQHGNHIDFDRLVELIGDTGPDTPTGARDTERTRIDVHHVHLPKLANAGLIEYLADRGEVTYQPNQLIQDLLETCS